MSCTVAAAALVKDPRSGMGRGAVAHRAWAVPCRLSGGAAAAAAFRVCVGLWQLHQRLHRSGASGGRESVGP
eukprot:11010158-Heterocapsa_arctica.AAC.1